LGHQSRRPSSHDRVKRAANSDIVQRRGRSHGRGTPDYAVWPIK
jgi:hypothetical protein